MRASSAPYLVTRTGPMTIHYGAYRVKDTRITVYEPVELTRCVVALSDDLGPQMLIRGRRWPVRSYLLAYNVDRVLTMDRYRRSPLAVHLYTFERYVVEGQMSRSREDANQVLSARAARPKLITMREYRRLIDSALILPTDFPDEARLLRNPCPENEVDAGEPDSLPHC